MRQLTFELHLLSIFVFQAIKITTKNKIKKDGEGVSKIKLVSTREERVTPQFRRPNFNFFLILSYFSMKKFAKYNLSLKPKLKNQYIYLRFPGDFSMFQQHTCWRILDHYFSSMVLSKMGKIAKSMFQLFMLVPWTYIFSPFLHRYFKSWSLHFMKSIQIRGLFW